MHLEQSGNTTKLDNVHLELPTEVQLRRRYVSSKDRKHLENGRKGKVVRRADPAPRGGKLMGPATEDRALDYRRVFSLGI